ncbi:hypothetical protein CR194_10525 [Salipaludibacillus keqinensis]|uniref:Uncharacterized protein n=1 Tax=Salipaludibacillus keqinensis TaxID=2045207 RepID=A0A323TGJ5_9BACI|nr:hypothetical protein [Salipaludibacillus keqinensis]PYZ93590.1 hypothetical protein CR194_10525 [Salipaludibacillus keqinensis]
MKKILLITLLFFIVMVGCSNNDPVEPAADSVDNTEDLETLISTNERLVDQLEKELEEKESLFERIQTLEEENMELKDDLLTYKQQTIEIEDRHEKELSLRHDLDYKSREFFQAMHEREHEQVEELTSSSITIDSEAEILHLTDQEGIERSFHYLQLDSVIYSRQRSFSYDHEEEVFSTEYEFYTSSEESMHFDGGVELIFENEEDWKVSSIRYVQ